MTNEDWPGNLYIRYICVCTCVSRGGKKKLLTKKSPHVSLRQLTLHRENINYYSFYPTYYECGTCYSPLYLPKVKENKNEMKKRRRKKRKIVGLVPFSFSCLSVFIKNQLETWRWWWCTDDERKKYNFPLNSNQVALYWNCTIPYTPSKKDDKENLYSIFMTTFCVYCIHIFTLV